MLKDRILCDFKDIIESRRVNRDVVGFMTRYWDPQPAYRVNKWLTPIDIKAITLENRRLNQILDELAIALNKNRNDIQREVSEMLEEIGLDRKMFVVRSLGIFVTKVLCRVCTSVFVNEKKIFSLKASLGSNPVIFVPTHRSYADFILMTYICFYFDIELPAVAAGMDFHAMVGMGRLMRDTCAFYIRRTFATDKIYSATFRQYVRTLVTRYHAPLGFFIEGTRSRTQKSLSPKYGFMSMVLEPLFTSEIPDATFVPISISYDRVMEERLFAFELLGVPKPKESTSAFFKALSILNENYGNIYVNVGTPISAKEYFGKSLNRSIHAIKPVEIHSLTNDENKLIQKLSHELVYRQQAITVVTTFQLIAVVINLSLHKLIPLTFEELYENIIWFSDILKHFNGVVFDYNKENIANEVKNVLATQQQLVRVDRESKIRILNTTQFLMTEDIKRRMKGHQLSEKTMCNVIPVIILQLYINPVLHLLISSGAIHLLAAKASSNNYDGMRDKYKKLRILLKNEFPLREDMIFNDFEDTLNKMAKLDAIKIESGSISLGGNKEFQYLLETLFWPFVNCVYRCSVVLIKEPHIDEKSLLKAIQKDLEWDLLNGNSTHPYSLTLDTILNCLQGFVADGCTTKEKKDNLTFYTTDVDQLTTMSEWIMSLLPKINTTFDSGNPVILNLTGVLARL